MTITERQHIANEVTKILQKDYPNYSKQTLANNALLELNDDLTLSVDDIVNIIKPKLKLRR